MIESTSTDVSPGSFLKVNSSRETALPPEPTASCHSTDNIFEEAIPSSEPAEAISPNKALEETTEAPELVEAPPTTNKSLPEGCTPAVPADETVSGPHTAPEIASATAALEELSESGASVSEGTANSSETPGGGEDAYVSPAVYPKEDVVAEDVVESVSRSMDLYRSGIRRSDEQFKSLEVEARAALRDLSANGNNYELASKYMNLLRVYREACQERALYMEADLVQQVLRHMRLDEETRHVRELTERQRREREALDSAHQEEMRLFHRTWNARIDEFEEQQLVMETALLERQNAELQEFSREVSSLAPRIGKCSRNLLDARAIEHILASQREYTRAHEVKMRADSLEVRDTERFNKARVELFGRREGMLRQRHQQERSVLNVKVERRRLELERARQKELDMLLRRYLNARRELELQQNIIRSKTGTMLLKHANNNKSDTSGSAMLLESAESGAFGTMVKH
ncbi:hypothetical protein ERJ75_000032400 [Trypanosoma vivax]|uniref:Uncharacterized protein n=1 Tax=Trypanosoma vivax (strain Y486) TaxID=1055687 RepID=G0U7P3_TRYVY|nr:hypothetical protein ERJ75_000032400 [Trypanosoma vivax]CCC51901.1 conserved hypothetical protein [Trypanosoma vivax Y486]